MDEDLLQPQPIAPKQIATIQMYADTPGDDSDLLNPQSSLKVSKSGATQEPTPGWQAGYKALGDRLTKGSGTITRGIAGVSTMFGTSFEDAQKQAETADLQKAEKDTEDYVNTHGYWDIMNMRFQPGLPTEGLVEEGNIDIHARPRVQNADGSISTVRSLSFNDGKAEVLIPTVSDDGRIMSDDEAIKYYKETGRHLGKFQTPAQATAYAEELHKQQEREYAQAPDENGLKISASDIPGWMVEQIPQLALTGVFAATGAGVGAIFGSLPGAALGSAVGAAIPAAFLSAGNHAYELQSRGADRQTATVAGAFVGAVNGTLETVGLGKLLGAAPDIAMQVAKSKAFRDSLGKIFKTLLHSTGTEIATEYTESLVESTSKIIAAKLNNKVKPVTSEEVLLDALQSVVQSAVVAGQIGSATTGGGVHAGLVAKAIQEKIDAAVAQEHAEQAQAFLQQQAADRAQDQAQAQQVQTATAQGQARARKSLRGFVEVKQGVSIDDAVVALNDAQAALDNATADDKAVLKLAVKQAQAELQQARLEAQVEELEDALSDPDLFSTVKQQREDLEQRIEKMKEVIDAAQADPDTDAATLKKLNKRLSVLKDSLKKVNELEALGSDEKVKAEVSRKKEEIAGKARKAREDVARVKLEGSIAERSEAISKLEKEIAADMKNKVESPRESRRRERLENLREQQEIDKLLLEGVADKTISQSDLKNLSRKIPAARLTGLVKVAQSHIESAAKLGGKEKAKFMTAARKLLGRVIDLARLPKKDQTALKAAISVKDVDALVASLPQLEAAIRAKFDARRLEAAHADLDRLLKRTKAKGDERSNFPGVEEILMKVKQFAADFDKVAEFEDYFMKAGEVTDFEEKIFQLIPQVFPVPVNQMTASQIEQLLDTVVELRETGTAEKLRGIDEKKARQAKKIDTALQRMTPTDRGEKRMKAVEGKLAKMLDDLVNSPSSAWDVLMTIVTQFGELSDMKDILDAKSAKSAFDDARINWEERFKKIVNDSGITAGAWQRLLIQGHKRAENIQYLYAVADEKTGNIFEQVRTLENDKGKPYTMWELVQIRNYLLDEDPDAKSRLKQGNKFSYPGEVERGSSTLEQVEAYLDEALPNWRKAADAMRQFYREFHDVVDEASFRRWGRHIPKNETYGGELISSTEDGGRFKERYRIIGNRPGSLKARRGGSSAVEIRGAFDNLARHIAQYARELAFMEFEQDAQAVFKDERVKSHIKRNIGENTLKIINGHIEDIVLGYNKTHTVVDKIFNHLRDSLYSRFLAARPEQFAKQATSIVYALQFVSPQEMVEGYQYMLANPEKANALMNKSGLYRARNEQMENVKPGVMNDIRRINTFLGGAVRAGDLVGVRGSAFPVLLKVLKETGSEEKAIKAFEVAFDTTQSSGNIDEQPLIFRANPIVRIFTALAQQPTRNAQDIITAWRAFRSNPTKATAAHYWRTVGVMYAGAFLYQAMGYLCAYPFMSDDEREKKLNFILDTAVLGPFSGVAVVGNVLTYMWVSTMKIVFNQNTRAFEPELLATNGFGDLAIAYTKLVKLGVKGGDTEDFWSLIMTASNGIGGVTGLPTTNILKKLEPFLGVKD